MPISSKSIIKQFIERYYIQIEIEINYRGRWRSFYSEEIVEEQKADETARSREEEKER